MTLSTAAIADSSPSSRTARATRSAVTSVGLPCFLAPWDTDTVQVLSPAAVTVTLTGAVGVLGRRDALAAGLGPVSTGLVGSAGGVVLVFGGVVRGRESGSGRTASAVGRVGVTEVGGVRRREVDSGAGVVMRVLDSSSASNGN